ncbi:hypothetical protein BJP25_21380 [Actinokineospora bangkokensis]|uniref:STAS domain-containing protein n=1 Tax=Actinokineospora bangkokensis TaxID=1193682 RepID=A0A1Q9LKT1_9PSEU|nr:hypothetical protein BJP25_21380 [Actinokineospora bangkokensis]
MLVRIDGVLDVAYEAVSEEIDDAVAEVVEADRDFVLIDLGEVTRLGTAGIAMLLRVREALGEIGVGFGVIAPLDAPAAGELNRGGFTAAVGLVPTLTQAVVTLSTDTA